MWNRKIENLSHLLWIIMKNIKKHNIIFKKIKILYFALYYKIIFFGGSAVLFGISVIPSALVSVNSSGFRLLVFTNGLSTEQPPGSLIISILCQVPSVSSHLQSQHSVPMTVRLWMPPCLSSCSFIWSRNCCAFFASHWQQIWTPSALKLEINVFGGIYNVLLAIFCLALKSLLVNKNFKSVEIAFLQFSTLFPLYSLPSLLGLFNIDYQLCEEWG